MFDHEPDGATPVDDDEAADLIPKHIRTRSELVHPFPNGNGRHARLWSDTILRQNGRPPFTWNNADLDQSSVARKAYIEALRAGDLNNYDPLIALILEGRD